MALLLSLLPPHAMSVSRPMSTSFDAFLGRSLGKWRGASYTWSPAETGTAAADPSASFMPLGIAPGYVTPPSPSTTEVVEVMRSCGGAVQGVEEKRSGPPAEATVMLNRQTDGTSFFGCGTWAVAPPQLSLPDDPNKDFMNSVECFGISLCMAHEDIRKRMLVVVAGNTVACVDVAVEELSAAAEAADANPGGSEAIEALLGKRLQCVVEANCWEGGAEVLTLTGAPPIVGTPWLNARTRWAKEEGAVEGGAQLVPSGCACYLPSGVWVQVRSVDDDAGKPGSRQVEVGSVCAETAEVLALTHEYSAAGTLTSVSLRRVEPR
jgi:hypothetical protein